MSRKEKSLGLLCQKFLAKYPKHVNPNERIIISLDSMAIQLDVERRRIYDIVNVLESVEILSRVCKNQYQWHGIDQLKFTLAKLKTLAVKSNFLDYTKALMANQFNNPTANGGLAAPQHGLSSSSSSTSSLCSSSAVEFVSSSEQQQYYLQPMTAAASSSIWTNKIYHHLEEEMFYDQQQATATPPTTTSESDSSGSSIGSEQVYVTREEKSLGIMSQKFLMLFLTSQDGLVSINFAARVLLGDIKNEITEFGRYKTKIRRLYDIANVLSSIGLIVKFNNQSMVNKPAYIYIGPKVAVMQDAKCVYDFMNAGNPSSNSKHSLFDHFKRNLELECNIPKFDISTGQLNSKRKKHNNKLVVDQQQQHQERDQEQIEQHQPNPYPGYDSFEPSSSSSAYNFVGELQNTPPPNFSNHHHEIHHQQQQQQQHYVVEQEEQKPKIYHIHHHQQFICAAGHSSFNYCDQQMPMMFNSTAIAFQQEVTPSDLYEHQHSCLMNSGGSGGGGQECLPSFYTLLN